MVEAVGTVSLVTGGDDNNDPLIPGFLDGGGERIGHVALPLVAEGKRDDPDVHAVRLPVGDDPLDPSDELSQRGRTAAVGNLHIDESSVWGDAGEVRNTLDRHATVVASDDARKVGSVAEEIDVGGCRVASFWGQVGAVDDLAVVEAVHLRDTGVDDGDVDALAAQSAVRTTTVDGVAEIRRPTSKIGDPAAIFVNDIINRSNRTVEGIICILELGELLRRSTGGGFADLAFSSIERSNELSIGLVDSRFVGAWRRNELFDDCKLFFSVGECTDQCDVLKRWLVDHGRGEVRLEWGSGERVLPEFDLGEGISGLGKFEVSVLEHDGGFCFAGVLSPDRISSVVPLGVEKLNLGLLGHSLDGGERARQERRDCEERRTDENSTATRGPLPSGWSPLSALSSGVPRPIPRRICICHAGVIATLGRFLCRQNHPLSGPFDPSHSWVTHTPPTEVERRRCVPQRCSAKKSVRSRAASSARTRSVTSTRWFKRGSSHTL